MATNRDKISREVDLARRLRRYYSEHAPEKVEKSKELAAKYVDNIEELFDSLTLKYGAEPQTLEISDTVRTVNIKLKTFHPGLKLRGLDDARASLAPVMPALERGAREVGGSIVFSAGESVGDFVVHLSVPDVPIGNVVDPVVVGSLRELVHNRYQIASGRKQGLLLADGTMPKNERRALEKARSLKKKEDRDKQGWKKFKRG